jgi:type II secretory pathway pseudopilin PulG
MTLVELLVVISTSALLIGILLPSLHTARQQTQRTVCLNNLRQMALAAQTYSVVCDDHYPTAYDSEGGIVKSAGLGDGTERMSLSAAIRKRRSALSGQPNAMYSHLLRSRTDCPAWRR